MPRRRCNRNTVCVAGSMSAALSLDTCPAWCAAYVKETKDGYVWWLTGVDEHGEHMESECSEPCETFEEAVSQVKNFIQEVIEGEHGNVSVTEELASWSEEPIYA